MNNDDKKIQQALEQVTNISSLELKRRGQYPYYTEDLGLEARRIIDTILENRRPMRVNADHVTTTTLRLQWYQGSLWLKDHFPEYKEKALRIQCKVLRGCIELRLKSNIKAAMEVIPWREEIDAFISSEPEINSKYSREDIALSKNDMAEIENMLIPLEKLFIWKITETSITIIRYDEA